ncbi:MAG: hypothetical protein MZV64_26405 [Ignavibacteriales bacterium]|nr:hypothetical protein [Ignavibacteriales bacterium]
MYNERMANIPDFEMWVRLCLKYNLHIREEKLIKFRIREDEANASGNKTESHIRMRFEHKQLLNHYLKIKNKNFFLEIFPEAVKYGKVEFETIPYFLARMAIDTNEDFRILWGLETLYKFIESEKNAQLLENDYGFSYLDFIKLTGNHNIYKIKHNYNDKKLFSWKYNKNKRLKLIVEKIK